MEQLTKHLQDLGLGEYEALVYATLVAISPTSATFLAKKCDLSRSSVYTTLSSLIAKGLVGVTYKNDVKQFIAEDHTALEQLVKKEKETLDKKFKIVESLKEVAHFWKQTNVQIPNIVFFEGQEGLKRIYLSMMRQAPKNSTRYLLRDEFVWEQHWEFIFKQDWNERVKRWATEKNMETKLLINSSKAEKDKVKFYQSQKATQFRFLPTENPINKFALYIIGDSVAILSMESNNLVGILITNNHIADNFKKTFNIIWNSSKK